MGDQLGKENEMAGRNYTITCVSGTVVLVRAKSRAAAEKQWDEAVDRGDAEERIGGTTERASRREVKMCVEMGHDYR
jgi:hypothetical protein